MSTLRELLQQISSAKEILATPLDVINPRTRAGFQSLQREERDKLPKLRAEYENTLLKNSLAFFVSGDEEKVKQFAALADAEGALVVPADGLLERLSTAIESQFQAANKTGAAREFGPTQFGLLTGVLRDVLVEIGYPSFEKVKMANIDQVPTHSSLLNKIREILLTSGEGADLLQRYFLRSLGEKAIAAEYDSPTVGVVVTNANHHDRMPLGTVFTKSVDVVISDNDVVDRDFVIAVFESTSTKKQKGKKQNKETADQQ